MTNRETPLALADRVEALSGPCRETDALIHLACRPFPERAYGQKNGLRPKGSPELSRVDFLKQGHAPPYTASIDSAMSLVGSDTWVEIKGPRKYLNIPTPVPNVWSANVSRWNHEGQATGWGATPALALTSASLRAIGEGL